MKNDRPIFRKELREVYLCTKHNLENCPSCLVLLEHETKRVTTLRPEEEAIRRVFKMLKQKN
jgi:hypothetical protein